MLSEAIAHYHDLLDTTTAHDSQKQLDAAMQDSYLSFGGRPLVTVLRPRLMTENQFALLETSCRLVGQAIRRLAKVALEGGPQSDEIRQILALTPLEQQLIEMDPGFAELSTHSRMDTFLTVDGNSMQMLEYNAESPAAIAYCDAMFPVFFDLPVVQRFQERYTMRPLPARHHLLDSLLSPWREAGSPGGTPTIAIVDWSGVPTTTEFELFRDYFEEQGIEAVVCTPDDLSFRENTLYARDPKRGKEMPTSIVYKRVLTTEFLEHYGDAVLEHPLIKAYAAHACVMVNSFRAKMLHKKSIFALLTDTYFQGDFTDDEITAIQHHLPWTRFVHDGETDYQNERINLLDFARKNRERLVLKPNDEYGGKGVTMGWECSDADWEQTLADAVKSPSVIQEKVTIAYEPYPALVDGEVVISDRLTDSNPYMFGSEVGGCLCRISKDSLLNITAGTGSTIPVFVISEKTA